MRISDWSSDVCSSDLRLALESARTGDIRSSAHVVHEPVHAVADIGLERGYNEARGGKSKRRRAQLSNHGRLPSRSGERCGPEIGRAAFRDRGCRYVWIPVVAVSLNNKKDTTSIR